MSIVMDISVPNDHMVSQQELYSRSLADNAKQIQEYEAYLEKLKVCYLSRMIADEIRRTQAIIGDLYTERCELSEKYLKAARDKK